MDDFEYMSHIRKAPASATVYQHIRRRRQALKDVRYFLKDNEDLNSDNGFNLGALIDGPHVFDPPQEASKAPSEQVACRAREWLLSIIASHETLMSREQEMRMFRSAVEKELAKLQEKWTDMERLYMTLSDPIKSTPLERFEEAISVVTRLDLATKLQDVNSLASQRSSAIKRTSALDAESVEIMEAFIKNIRDMTVDHFACAIPISSLHNTQNDIVDANQGCCPICQNSYTDLSTNTVADLLADFPVRIKYCGHILGKACLEQWMKTPKIDEAKYPHRTCPLCRVEIEGVRSPPVPKGWLEHVRKDRRAMETLWEMVYGWDVELDDCSEGIVQCMSVEIAIEEVKGLVEKQNAVTGENVEGETVLAEKMEGVKEFKRMWGFRGDRVWRRLRDEWQSSGASR